MNAKAHSSASSDYRRALGQFATGVCIVTTTGATGEAVGLTVNSFNSVSLAPPLVLWSLGHGSASSTAFEAAAGFVVHVLGVDQLELARRFSTRGVDKFGATAWAPSAKGLPLIEGCVASFECHTVGRHRAGDHTIFVGEVLEFHAPGGTPLIFHSGRYVSEVIEAPLPRDLRDPWPKP
ncbi:MAG: flavin reductase family protein [Burkholderiaceae bacterium]